MADSSSGVRKTPGRLDVFYYQKVRRNPETNGGLSQAYQGQLESVPTGHIQDRGLSINNNNNNSSNLFYKSE